MEPTISTIYRPARLDPTVPIEDTIGAISELIQAGYVRAPGLSELGAETISRAQRVHPIADVQLEYSVISRGAETQILPLCEQLGIGLTAYGVLSRGLLTGSQPAATNGFRKHLPRFSGQNLVHNQKLVEALNRLAETKHISTSQLCSAWALAKGDRIVPVIGARTRQQLADALGAFQIVLTPDDIARIEQAVASHGVAGTRYGEPQMRLLDSER